MAGRKRTVIEWNTHPTDAHFTLLKLLRSFWNISGMKYHADFYNSVDVRFEIEGVRLRLYTDKRRYSIWANLGQNYLGCTMSMRAPYPSEDWTRGSDLHDGPFDIENWKKIISDILACELLDIAESVINNPEWQKQNKSQ